MLESKERQRKSEKGGRGGAGGTQGFGVIIRASRSCDMSARTSNCSEDAKGGGGNSPTQEADGIWRGPFS